MVQFYDLAPVIVDIAENIVANNLCRQFFNDSVMKPDLTRKARFVAGGHMMKTPSLINYLGLR